MSQTTKNFTKSTEMSPVPSPTTSTPADAMAINKSINKIRPTLSRNQSSFTQALGSVTASDQPYLNLPEDLDSTTLDDSTKITIKNDVKLVKEVHPELSLTIPKISTPLHTPLPIPNSKPAFVDAVKAEVRKVGLIKAGLQRYIVVIHSEEHTVFSPTFLAQQTKSTNTTCEELDDLSTKLGEIIDEVTEMATPALTPCVTPSKLTPTKPSASTSNPATPKPSTSNTTCQDYFGLLTVQEQDPVKNELKEKFAALRVMVAKIRVLFVGCHVFYKINYALCADKKVVKTEETEETEEKE